MYLTFVYISWHVCMDAVMVLCSHVYAYMRMYMHRCGNGALLSPLSRLFSPLSRLSSPLSTRAHLSSYTTTPLRHNI